MFPMIAMAGLSILGGIAGGAAQRRAAKNQTRITKAQTYADAVTREANNISASAESSLADYVRSLNNQRNMQAAGDQYNVMGENLGRVLQQNTKGNFAQKIQAAEQMGALAAQNAWAGVGGSTVDMIDSTMRLRDAMIEEDVQRQQGYMTYDMVRQQAGVVASGVGQLDFRQAFANVDTKSSITPYVHTPGWDTILTNTALKALPMAFQALGSMGGGAAPAAGAVMQVGSTSTGGFLGLKL